MYPVAPGLDAGQVFEHAPVPLWLVDYSQVKATLDQLTGLDNKTMFDEECSRLEYSRQYPISVLAARVEDLELVRQERGWDAGESLLRCAAEVLHTAFRSEDVVARLGGNLFGVLLPATGREALDKGVLRIRQLSEINNALCRDPRLRLALGTATALDPGKLRDAWRLAEACLVQEDAEGKESRGNV